MINVYLNAPPVEAGAKAYAEPTIDARIASFIFFWAKCGQTKRTLVKTLGETKRERFCLHLEVLENRRSAHTPW